MKKTIKILSLALSIIMILSVGLVGCKKEEKTVELTPIEVEATYEPLRGIQSDWLFSNPDRGYRTEICLRMSTEEGFDNDDWRNIYSGASDEEIMSKLNRLISLYVKANTNLAIAYIGFNNCNTAEKIPERYFEILDMFFDLCRQKELRILWRHAYGVPTNKYIANEEDRKLLATVCADEETMVRHIKQVGEYIGKHTDVIQKVSSGVIGNGEFVAAFQWPPVDFNTVLDAIVRYMCVPNGLEMSIRMPRYKKDLCDFWLEEYGEEYPYADLIGINNDAVFGETDKTGFESGCWQYNHKTCGANCFNNDPDYFDEWAYTTKYAAYTSQSGEMFTNLAMINNNVVPTGINVIKQMAHHRFTTLSHWHTLGEAPGSDNVMKRWIENETVTPELLDSLGIIYDPEYFNNPDGSEIHRDPYQFIRDHLGYKLVADKSNLKGELGPGGKLTVDLSFKNYGFAAPFFLESGFAILDSRYNLVSEVKAGNPEEWISLPADYYVTERSSSVQDDVLSYKVSAELTLPETAGKYYVAFYMKNSLGTYAMLSNDIPFEGKGFNILHTIEIK